MESTKRVIKIAIAEDQSIFRNGLVRLLNEVEDFEIVLAVENGQILLEELKKTKVDLALLDFRMPGLNGLETTKAIREHFNHIKVLLLSLYDNSEFVELAIENGANGYLSKDDEAMEIQRAIRSTMEMGYYLNDRTNKMLIAKMIHSGKIQPIFDTNQKTIFTDVEMEVLDLICKEYTTAEISEKLFRSPRTIESIRSQMLQKIGARNVVGLVMYAVKNNLIVSIRD